ncbi:conjugative transfer signal peptidase TraF [Agrobacterium tumefaciens]|uniref:Conjugative transfer signal peptidase TraF n=1 Tax=Agrobacterium tumefaciens TaxID=358 RepID=A0AA44J7W8_AGRTU|nr:conjugative transfer signal peptidase TraF [Agrobacterium tumefaciens]NSL21628.1 conjugative transfer signal peptidase TraF [Agrobacterium tumefaciens]NTC16621.1 conjugative transfer signal peptidase TraF [Agrobacterium tumefaciens]NTC28059.1 conjugative transfer signal peptidase TraF [Agrobacterium tumefaciens]NTC58231.1 conjugative transfer signal peptidase TraF [Agrobacterium tumefaciens]NTC60221.1 conjugative transfer signal peptidase TraF [Agrobacterium tumefaciens]
MRRRVFLFLAGAGGAIAALAAVAYMGGFRLNLTPSEPLGLWRIVALQRPVETGDLVFICPPPTASFEEARRRGYLRLGLCPRGFAPLIKTVAALPGQHVEIGANVTVDGRPLASSIVRASDGEGRPITPFKTGIVPLRNLFLHSSFASSYDSRYFGPVPDTGLLGLARPVLTFEP